MDLDSTTKILPDVTKKQPVDIQFNKLSYNAGKKHILKSISGKFSSGNLVGILGCSGAGKTTLLNVLAGHLQKGVTGQIYINDEPRIIKSFHKLASYIMQEDIVQPYLTVMESICVAANLKIGSKFSDEEKQSRIMEVLSVMGLKNSLDTRVENLSGGEKKRFLIALELVNNPPVVFLDEPTTGLDDVAMRNCLRVLKSCALQGRTIITTIHQPSASLIELFDTIYFLSDGHCIYNGKVNELVPFLSESGFTCPTNYNPADFIIEIVHSDYCNTLVLKERIKNGEILRLDNDTSKKIIVRTKSIDNDSYEQNSDANDFATSFWEQLRILLGRTALQVSRKTVPIAIVFGLHILTGILFGLFFYRHGMNGSNMQASVKLYYTIVIHFVFSYCMSPILLYPFEIKLLEREYFNRWYSLKAYYTALIISLVPMLILPIIMFVILVYSLTEQPPEWDRFLWFTIVCVLTAIAAERMGYAIGTILEPTEGAVVGSGILMLLVLLSIHGVGHGEEIEDYMKILLNFSFPYHSFVGIGVSVLANRGILECDDICYFGDTKFALYKLGWTEKAIHYEVLYLLVFTVIHQIIAYTLLKFRIAPELTTIRNSLKVFKL